MNRNTNFIVGLAVLQLGVALGFSQAQPAGKIRAPHVEGELLVKFRDGPRGKAARDARNQMKYEVKRRFNFIGWQQIKLPVGMNVEKALVEYADLPEVVAVEPNFIAGAPAERQEVRYAAIEGGAGTACFFSGGDPLAYTQWNLHRIGAPLAWTVSTGSTNVVVAILNTGINYLHEDLRDNMWRNPGEIPANGVDDDANGFIDDVYGIDTADDPHGNDSDPWDESDKAEAPIYRGSAVASIIGAAHNAVGIAGINANVRLMALRAVTTNGTMSFADQIDALNYLVLMKNRGVNIKAVQISNGGTAFSAAAKAAHDAVGNAGILVAAGIQLTSQNLDVTPRYPACFDSPGMMAVTASSIADLLMLGANFGRTNVDLAAPGLNIIMASGPRSNDYVILQGTSQASAHVAGAAGLLAAAYPNATVQQIKEALIESADILPAFTNKMVSNGRLNLARALFHRHIVSNAAPLMVSEPHSESVPPGSTVTFRASAAGTEPLHYLWQRDGADLVQSARPSLTLTNLLAGDAGEYRVVVSNAFGAITSAIARLVVQPEPATFTKITSGPHVTTAGNNLAVAWGDYDNDNDPDLFVARDGGGNLFYRNNGDGTFSTVNAGVADSANSWGCGWGDYDRDGFLDLFVANGGNQGPQNDFLFRNNGNGTFMRMTTNAAGPIAAGGGASIDCAWADYDRDGFVDLFVGNGSLDVQQDQANFLFELFN